MDLDIAGRTALVTGADSGIGRATVAALLAEGVTVVATAPEQDSLDAMVAETGVATHRLRAFAADVTSTEQVLAVRDSTHREVGPIDIVVHAAGITGAQGLFHEVDEAGWQHTLDVNLMGAVRVRSVERRVGNECR